MKTLRMIRDSSALVSPSDTNSDHNNFNNNSHHHQNLFDTIYLTPTTTTNDGYKHGDDPTNGTLTTTSKREHEQMMMMRNDDPMNNDRSHHQHHHHHHHHHRMDAWERRQIAQKITRNTMFSLFDKMEHSNWFQALQRKINNNTMTNNNNNNRYSSQQSSSYHNPYAAYSRQEQLIRSLVDRWLQFKDQFGNTRRKIGELASAGGAKREREEGDDRAAARDIADRIDQYLFREKRRREHNQRTKRNVSTMPNQSFQQQQMQLQLQQQQQHSQGYYGNMRRFGFWKRIRKSYQWFINCVFESILWIFKLLFRQFLKT